MGAGDIFRGVAQGLLGAGTGAIDYALERNRELRKQQWLEKFYGIKQQMTPLEEERVRSQILYNTSRAEKAARSKGGAGGGRRTGKILKIINDNTGQLRFVESPAAGETLQLEDGERLISTSSGKDPYLAPEPLVPEPPEQPNLFRRMFGNANPPRSNVPPAPGPSPASRPRPATSAGSEQSIVDAVNSRKISVQEGQARLRSLRGQ